MRIVGLTLMFVALIPVIVFDGLLVRFMIINGRLDGTDAIFGLAGTVVGLLVAILGAVIWSGSRRRTSA